MVHLLTELFGQWIRSYIHDGELILGIVVGLAFWSLDYSLVELRHRRHWNAAGCALIGFGILSLLLLPRWNGWALFRIMLTGLLWYLPLRLARTRMQAR